MAVTVEGQLVGTGVELVRFLGSAFTGTALQTLNLYFLADQDLLSWVHWLTIGKGAVRA